MNLPRFLPFLRRAVPAPKIALVLGGGAARGFAHIGVIQELERQNIPISLVVGTSVGSLIGAIYACCGDSAKLEAIARPIRRKDIFDYDLKTFLSRAGLVDGETLQKFVAQHVPCNDFAQLKIPFVAVATDLVAGRTVVLDRGPVDVAVRASCAIPGIFPPVRVDDQVLVDGWVLENIPVCVARQMGADIVIAVDVSIGVADNQLGDLIDVIVQSITIMSAEHMKKSKAAADIVISPDMSGVKRMDFEKKEFCLEAGVVAARDALPEIRGRIASWRKPGWWQRFRQGS